MSNKSPVFLWGIGKVASGNVIKWSDLGILNIGPEIGRSVGLDPETLVCCTYICTEYGVHTTDLNCRYIAKSRNESNRMIR